MAEPALVIGAFGTVYIFKLTFSGLSEHIPCLLQKKERHLALLTPVVLFSHKILVGGIYAAKHLFPSGRGDLVEIFQKLGVEIQDSGHLFHGPVMVFSLKR